MIVAQHNIRDPVRQMLRPTEVVPFVSKMCRACDDDVGRHPIDAGILANSWGDC